jgi:hypothetical protein
MHQSDSASGVSGLWPGADVGDEAREKSWCVSRWWLTTDDCPRPNKLLRGLGRSAFCHLAQDIECSYTVGFGIGRKVEDIVDKGFDR